MRKLNRYEQKMMINLHVITFLCVAASVLNIVLPLMEVMKFSIFLLTQLVVIGGIYVFGWVSSRGSQSIPIGATLVIRGLQALIFVLWARDVSWVTFGVLFFIDVLFIVAMLLDKANYRYVLIKREDDEFFDD